MVFRKIWSPTGKACGTSMKILFYAKASEVIRQLRNPPKQRRMIWKELTHSSTGKAHGLLRRRIKGEKIDYGETARRRAGKPNW